MVWQESMNLAEKCYFVTRNFPKEERYEMVSQIRRAAASIPANVAEGHGRKTLKQYTQFLYIAQGSLKELETHLILSKRVKLSSSDAIESLLSQCESVGRLLSALIRALENKN